MADSTRAASSTESVPEDSGSDEALTHPMCGRVITSSSQSPRTPRRSHPANRHRGEILDAASNQRRHPQARGTPPITGERLGGSANGEYTAFQDHWAGSTFRSAGTLLPPG